MSFLWRCNSAFPTTSMQSGMEVTTSVNREASTDGVSAGAGGCYCSSQAAGTRPALSNRGRQRAQGKAGALRIESAGLSAAFAPTLKSALACRTAPLADRA